MKIEKELREQIRKEFRRLGIPEEHIEHLKKCESCYNYVVKHIKRP